MKRLICTIATVVVLPTVVNAQGKGHGKHEAQTTAFDGVKAEVHVVFSSHDVELIREHYATRYRNLPPGLQKKLARTGSLPPGWKKKIEPMPVTLERQLVVLPSAYRRGVIDGHAVIYRPNVGVVVDATILFY